MLNFLSRAFASIRSQKGLYHGKDVHTGYSYTFSHRATKRTFRPNVHKKSLWSDALRRSLEIEVSMKALKCIRKAGGLDNYLLKTDPHQVRSQYGALLKSHIEKKKSDPNYQVPYIPRTWKKRTNINYQFKWYQQALYRPPELKNTDYTLDDFDPYDKTAPPRMGVVKVVKEEEVKISDVFSSDQIKLQRKFDEDTEENLNEKIEIFRSIGIDENEEDLKSDKKKQKPPEKKGKKSRSRQIYEAKMNKIEKRISGETEVPDTKLIKELREDINRLKGIKK